MNINDEVTEDDKEIIAYIIKLCLVINDNYGKYYTNQTIRTELSKLIDKEIGKLSSETVRTFAYWIGCDMREGGFCTTAVNWLREHNYLEKKIFSES